MVEAEGEREISEWDEVDGVKEPRRDVVPETRCSMLKRVISNL